MRERSDRSDPHSLADGKYLDETLTLNRAALSPHLSNAVVSSCDKQEVAVKCLALGAIDFLIKPLRSNELRQLWTRLFWWRRSGPGSLQQGLAAAKPLLNTDTIDFHISSSEDSQDTQW